MSKKPTNVPAVQPTDGAAAALAKAGITVPGTRSISAQRPATATPQRPTSTAPAGFRPAAFPPTALVRIVSGANPKRPGTKAAKAWGAYTDDKGRPLGTVQSVMERFKAMGFSQRYARSALRWDSQHGFIEIKSA